MEHLTIDEILEFISIEEYNEKNIELATRVNTHIRNCKKCFDAVKAFQVMYDEFVDMSLYAEFKEHLYNEFANNNEEMDETVKEFMNSLEEGK